MIGGTKAVDVLGGSALAAAERAADSLLSIQSAEGYWWADLFADTTLESDFVLLQLWLDPPVADEQGRMVWNPASKTKIAKAARSILGRQLPEGGFPIFPGGPADLNATIKAYTALKLSGLSEHDERMSAARSEILARGGLQEANSYVKINLSFFGLFPRESCPTIPPEMVLLGNFIYEMSSWTRSIVVPLSIVHALKPLRPVPDGFSLSELFAPGGAPFSWFKDRKVLTWRNFFLTADQLCKWWERHGSETIRKKAIHRAEQWMLERTKYSDGLAAIYPAMMYVIMALDVLGYAADHPDRVEAQRQFDNLMIEGENELTFQPCFSPVWDTAIASYALGESGLASAEALQKTGSWLLTKEVRRPGDWSVKRPHTVPSGWYFEFANEFYPDIDDTAMVLLGLQHCPPVHGEAHNACVRRAVNWLLAMQGRDGGWAAFDVDNNWEALSYVPFADHNAMLDPSCPDITGRVIDALRKYGVPLDAPAIQNGLNFLLKSQEQDGCWHGRWGVNYIYGTYLALRGLRAAGLDDREACVLRAGEWLRSVQNADGGWGESCLSYEKEAFVPAPSTPSQTAWAILGLLASGDDNSLSIRKGVEFLVSNQNEDGTWNEEAATGTGFPKVFYLQYRLYRNSFPLLALSHFVRTRREVA